MVGADGTLPLPWLEQPLARALQSTAHALLLHGPEGVGQFELALTLAQAWLCEREGARRPCGDCPSCRLVRARSHPDLLVLVPEALREALGWASASDVDEGGEKGSKAKPSKEIKVEAVRGAVQFAQTTSARGRSKVVVVHPAERMNPIAANTLLKTLEEPPGDARFALASGAPDLLLPTIRSRCQAMLLDVPASGIASTWLSSHGVAGPDVLLAACGGQPLLALEWHEDGIDASLWQRVPSLLERGDASAFTRWPLPRLIEALQKVCHDAISVSVGALPRYLPTGALRGQAALPDLLAWSRELSRLAPSADHPWHPGLTVEALVDAARRALAGSAPVGPRASGRYT